MGVLNCRVLKSGKCEISQRYKGASHKGIDLVCAGYTLDYVVAHSAGTVVAVVANCNRNTSKTGERIYGNYVKIKHDDGYYTLYAHLKYGTVAVSNGQRVDRGQTLGYMGNTGYSFGAHLHWEVRDRNDHYIDPTPYLDADLPDSKPVFTKIMYVNTKSLPLNVRQSPNGTIIGSLNKGTKVNVVKYQGDWALINSPVNGWVSTEYLSDNPPSGRNTVGEYRYLKANVKLWSNPNLTGTSYDYLKGTKVKILENVSDEVDKIYVPATGRTAYINIYWYR